MQDAQGRQRAIAGAVAFLLLIAGSQSLRAQNPPAGQSLPSQPDSEDATDLLRQAIREVNAGRLVEAEALYQRAIARSEQVLGADHPTTLTMVSDLADVYVVFQQRNAGAEPLYRRVVEARERVRGPEDTETLAAVMALAETLSRLERADEAEALARRALAGRERVLGADNPDTLAALSTLARMRAAAGAHDEGAMLYRRLIAAYERVGGREHPGLQNAIGTLAWILTSTGRYADAEPFYAWLLEIRERTNGPNDAMTLAAMIDLADVRTNLARYSQAEPLYRRVLEAGERLFDREHAATLRAASQLASLYRRQGRHSDAEPLIVRVFEVTERRNGWGEETTLAAADDLAGLYIDTARYAEAEPILQRALAASENLLGAEHMRTLGLLEQLGRFLSFQDRHAEAGPVYRRLLAATERARGAEHSVTLRRAERLAVQLWFAGRYADAEPLLRRIAVARERTLGRDHPDTLFSMASLVVAEITNRTQSPTTLETARRMVEGMRQRRGRAGSSQDGRMQGEREALGSSWRLELFADAAWAVTGDDSGQRNRLLPEAFSALQLSMTGSGNRAIADQAARRYAEGRDQTLADLVRERQQLERDWSRLDADLAAAFASDVVNDAADVRAQMDVAQARIAAIDERLREDAPDYFAIVAPTPLDIAAAQGLLAPDDAILMVVPGPFASHVVAVTHDRIAWHRSDWDENRVRRAVQRLRWDAGATVEGSESELAALETTGASGAPGFDRGLAHDLYRELVAPAADLISGKRRLYVAAGGTLATLPFHLLVSRAPEGADNDPHALRSTRWFGDQTSLVHIPSLQSLALLHGADRASTASSFIGIGDPVLAGEAAPRDRGAAAGLRGARETSLGGRRNWGAVANVGRLRQMTRLPGTAQELEAVRQALAAPQSSLFLAERATETNVRAADLGEAAVLLFSTHALTAAEAGQIGMGEAGLVLTPPIEAREEDDGFLSASEVMTLRLDADWVILSACNTATGDGRDAAGLGPLAQAFFYAGARNLLASHWPVNDAVAPILVTRMLALEQAGTPRAEAFHTAMMEIRMDVSYDSETDSWAHPYYWAPFVVIGNGGR